MTRRHRWSGQEGSASVELAVLAPVLLLVLGLVLAAGRVVTAQATVDQAATVAARAASLARTPQGAATTAAATAAGVLAQQGLLCTGHSVSVDTSGLSTPPGVAGQVSAHVSCTVNLADLLMPGLPGHKTLISRFSSTVDPFRGRP